MVKMVMPTEARSFGISEFKNLLQKPLNSLQFTEICDPSRS